MLHDLARAFGQLTDRRFLALVLGSCLLSALLVVGLALAAGRAMGALTGVAWLDLAAGLAGGAAALAAGLVCFPAVVAAVQGLLLERAARAVERRHYPALGPPREQGWGELVRQTLRFAGWALALNLLLLPVWLLAAPLALPLFWLANGWLFGREYFAAAALRRVEPEAADALWRRHRLRLWLAGALLAWLMTAPLLNLATPALGAAFMLHRFERLRSPQEGGRGAIPR